MRKVAWMALVGAALPASASACPRDLQCIALTQVLPAPVEQARVQPAHPRAVSLVLHRFASVAPEPGLVPPLRVSLASFEPAAPRTDAVEMPWIWAVLSAEVYSRLPRYDQAQHQFSMVLSPVVVTSPSESTPGVGLAGDF